MFQVQLDNMGSRFWLKSTIWTSAQETCNTFETREAAQAALDKAKKFMKATMFKKAVIVEVAQ